MPPISYARHQFPPVVIQHAAWLYLRFALSYRDAEDLLAERGLEVSYETIRRLGAEPLQPPAPALGRRLPHPGPGAGPHDAPIPPLHNPGGSPHGAVRGL